VARRERDSLRSPDIDRDGAVSFGYFFPTKVGSKQRKVTMLIQNPLFKSPHQPISELAMIIFMMIRQNQ
jgi:hypothetical protein